MEGKENLGFSSKNPTFLVVPDLQRQNTYVYDADRRLSEMTVSYFFPLKVQKFNFDKTLHYDVFEFLRQNWEIF